MNDNFRIDASIGYLDTEIDAFNSVDGLITLATGTNVERTVSAADNIELPFAPEFQVNVGANYSFHLGNGAEIRNRLDYFYEAEQHTTIANYNADLVPSTTRVNYLATYIPADGNWELTAGARNITDEEDITNVNLSTGPAGSLFHVLSRGREAYLQFKYSFGE